MDIDTLCREPVVFDPASADAVLAAFSGSAERIRHHATNFDDLSHRLREHADMVYGQTPEPPSTAGNVVGSGACEPSRPGALGAIHDALDYLEASYVRAGQAVARNTQLA